MNIEIERKELQGDASELRYDLLSGEWVIIATGRGKRPDEFATSDEDKAIYDPATDPFAEGSAQDQEEDVLIYRDHNGEWTTRVFPNKYPAVLADHEVHDLSFGPYGAMSGYGHHEVLVVRDPERPYALLELYELAEVIDAYQDRYLTLMRERSVKSVTIFHNHGKKAGASVVHPHSQIVSLPIVLPSVAREIAHSERFFNQNNVSLFEAVVEHEARTGMHVVKENEDFIAYCPFASERAFQIRIIPKRAQAYFERVGNTQKVTLAEVLGDSLRALFTGLNDPDFNFYIRTAPCDGQDYGHYRWHIDIMPRTHLYAGFEFASDIEVVPVRPEDAAKFLREQI